MRPTLSWQGRGYGFAHIWSALDRQVLRHMRSRAFKEYCGDKVARLFRRSARAERSSESPTLFDRIARSVGYSITGNRIVIWAQHRTAAIKQYGKRLIQAGSGPYSHGRAKALTIPTSAAGTRKVGSFGDLEFRPPKGGYDPDSNFVGTLHEWRGWAQTTREVRLKSGRTSTQRNGMRAMVGPALFLLYRSIENVPPHQNMRRGGPGWMPTYSEVQNELVRATEMFRRYRI